MAAASHQLLSHAMPAARDSNGARTIAQQHQYIWIVTGPAGCGKSTVAAYLADQLSLPYVEGDEFHPQANIDKMSSGTPLTDADRWDWLIRLRQHSVAELASGSRGVIVTCSALKHKYRDVIRIASYEDSSILVRFIYLQASEELLLERVKARQGHYMKDDMVKSQFSSLEEPDTGELDCLVVDVGGTMEEVQQLSLRTVTGAMEQSIRSEHSID